MNISKNYLFLFCCIFLLHTIDLNGQEIDWLIEPSLELKSAKNFKNGLAVIRSKDGKSGVIDKTGKIIVPMIYDGIEDFKYGMARAYKDNQRMIIDSTGKVLCTLNRKETQSWSLGIEHVSEDIFLVGNLASEPRYGYGLITKHGKKLSSFDFAWGYISEFYDHGIDYKFVDGLCLMTKAKEGEEYFKFGFVDKNGKTIIPFKYDYAEHFSEGLALVAKGKIGYEMKYGFIDKTGKLVLPMIYDGVRPFKNGLAGVYVRGKGGGIINKKGEFVVEPKYVDLGLEFGTERFEDGLMVLQDYETDKYGVINRNGRVVAPFEYDMAYGKFSDGLLRVKRNGKMGAIDKTGQLVIPCIYHIIYDFHNGTAQAVLNQGGKNIIIDKNGNEVPPKSIEGVDIHYSQNGFHIATKDKKYGVVNNLDKTIVPFIYDKINFDKYGFAVKIGNKYGLLDFKGNPILPIAFDVGRYGNSTLEFSEGLSWVKQDGKYGIMQIQQSKRLFISWITPNIDYKNNQHAETEQLLITVKALGGENLQKEDFKVYINGALQRTNKAGELSLKGTTFSTVVTLSEGKNNIYVQVGTKKSKTLTVNYSARKPTLHILAVAPNFENNLNTGTLHYTDEDAQDIINVFKTQEGKGVYSEVKIHSLIGDKATATNILKGAERLKMQYKFKEIHPRDVVLFFASSHGFIDNNEFYIKGDDFDPYSPTSTSIPSERIMSHLAEIDCKKIIILDACFSGGARDDEEVRRINEIINSLTNQQKGVVTFTSSKGSQKSWEHANWNNGAFTYTLVNGLKGAADKNRDGIITLNELNEYLSINVPSLVKKQYNEIQTPTMKLKGLDGDLPIFIY